MQFYKQNEYLSSPIYVYSPEIANAVCFKQVRPHKCIVGTTNGTLYNSIGKRYRFEQFDLNNPIISDRETKK